MRNSKKDPQAVANIKATDEAKKKILATFKDVSTKENREKAIVETLLAFGQTQHEIDKRYNRELGALVKELKVIDHKENRLHDILEQGSEAIKKIKENSD